MKRRESLKFVTCPGSRIHVHYTPRFDGEHLVLEESGRSDIQKEIESYGRYTDLHYMLHRLSVGDASVVSSRPPVFGDFSGLPSNPIDAINLVHTAERRFGELSQEERAVFNNDYRAWLSSVLSGGSSGKNPVSGSPVADKPVVKEEVKIE